MDTPDIVERLRAPAHLREHEAQRVEAAQEIERLRVACAGALNAAYRVAQSNIKLRQRLDELASRK